MARSQFPSGNLPGLTLPLGPGLATSADDRGAPGQAEDGSRKRKRDPKDVIRGYACDRCTVEKGMSTCDVDEYLKYSCTSCVNTPGVRCSRNGERMQARPPAATPFPKYRHGCDYCNKFEYECSFTRGCAEYADDWRVSCERCFLEGGICSVRKHIRPPPVGPERPLTWLGIAAAGKQVFDPSRTGAATRGDVDARSQPLLPVASSTFELHYGDRVLAGSGPAPRRPVPRRPPGRSGDGDGLDTEDSDDDEIDDGGDGFGLFDNVDDGDSQPKKKGRHAKPWTLVRNRCWLCYLQKTRFCDMTDEHACTRCQRWGLECHAQAGTKSQRGCGELRPARNAYLAGTGSWLTNISCPPCPPCEQHGRNCDRKRPCDSCVQHGEDPAGCEEIHSTHRRRRRRDPKAQPAQPRMSGWRSTFERGTAPGEDSAMYYLACGYGPGGVNDPRPIDRLELPGPVLPITTTALGRRFISGPRYHDDGSADLQNFVVTSTVDRRCVTRRPPLPRNHPYVANVFGVEPAQDGPNVFGLQPAQDDANLLLLLGEQGGGVQDQGQGQRADPFANPFEAHPFNGTQPQHPNTAGYDNPFTFPTEEELQATGTDGGGDDWAPTPGSDDLFGSPANQGEREVSPSDFFLPENQQTSSAAHNQQTQEPPAAQGQPPETLGGLLATPQVSHALLGVPPRYPTPEGQAIQPYGQSPRQRLLSPEAARRGNNVTTADAPARDAAGTAGAQGLHPDFPGDDNSPSPPPPWMPQTPEATLGDYDDFDELNISMATPGRELTPERQTGPTDERLNALAIATGVSVEMARSMFDIWPDPHSPPQQQEQQAQAQQQQQQQETPQIETQQHLRQALGQEAGYQGLNVELHQHQPSDEPMFDLDLDLDLDVELNAAAEIPPDHAAEVNDILDQHSIEAEGVRQEDQLWFETLLRQQHRGPSAEAQASPQVPSQAHTPAVVFGETPPSPPVVTESSRYTAENHSLGPTREMDQPEAGRPMEFVPPERQVLTVPAGITGTMAGSTTRPTDQPLASIPTEREFPDGRAPPPPPPLTDPVGGGGGGAPCEEHVPSDNPLEPRAAVRARDAGTARERLLYACGRPSGGRACEHRAHALADPHHVCGPCDARTRGALGAALRDDDVLAMRAYACAGCVRSGALDASALAGSGARVWGYEPFEGEGKTSGGGGGGGGGGFMGAPLPITGCACGEKLWGRVLCQAHRFGAADRVFDLARAFQAFRAEGWGGPVCPVCKASPGMDYYRFRGDEGGAGLGRRAWACLVCHGIVVADEEQSTGLYPGWKQYLQNEG